MLGIPLLAINGLRPDSPSMPARSLLSVSLLLGVVSATGLSGALLTRPASAVELNCAAPQPGRYVVMGQGQSSGEPVARILQETWKPDGTLQGVRLERRGSRYAETTYTGSYRALSKCRASISRRSPLSSRASTSFATLNDSTVLP